jgi:carbamate kinase
MTIEEARGHLADGQFPPGSMGPKIEAVLSFLEAGGRRALITNPSNLERAMRGESGTLITNDNS